MKLFPGFLISLITVHTMSSDLNWHDPRRYHKLADELNSSEDQCNFSYWNKLYLEDEFSKQNKASYDIII